MMNKLNMIFVLFLSIGAIQHAVAQTPAIQSEAVEGPVMTFENLVVDYGAIEQHSEPLRVAKFTNTGSEPLVIKNARGSCGCTVPTWPKQPIMPGESAELEIRYDTKRVGSINKTVTITTNQAGDPIVLKVKGKISKAAKQESVPKPKTGLFKKTN